MNFIFIHIPKTAGTTLLEYLGISTIRQSFSYRHISYITKNSNCGDIFNNKTNNVYKNHKIVLIMREPIFRLESEYNFYNIRDNFKKLYKEFNNKDYPKTFEDYVNCPSTHNSNIKFLLGRNLFDPNIVTLDDYNNVIIALNKLNLAYGIVEDFENSFKNILFFLDKLPDENRDIVINNKRINYNKLKIQNMENIISKFNENNKFDNMLYNFIKEKFYLQIKEINFNNNNQNIKFVEDKNDYYKRLYNFLTGFNNNKHLIELYINDKLWLDNNSKKLQIIHKILLTQLNMFELCDGKSYCIKWINLVIKTYNLDITENQINFSHPHETIKIITKKLLEL